MGIKDTLAERQKTHGSFRDHAYVSQRLKDVCRSQSSWENLTFSQREAIDMILHKIARAIAGSPNFPDHWHDIAGYATLIEEELKQ